MLDETEAWRWQNDYVRRVESLRRGMAGVFDMTLPFAERIGTIPLFWFGRPFADGRSPVAYQCPFRSEVVAIAEMVQSLAGRRRVCDIGTGNGLIGSLLLQEGLDVFAIDDGSYKAMAIESLRLDGLVVDDATLADPDVEFDIAYCSWPTPGWNAAVEIASKRPKLMILVLSLHGDVKGQPVTGTTHCLSAPSGYSPITAWVTRRPSTYHGGVLAIAGSEELELFKATLVYGRSDVDVTPSSPSASADTFPWDEDRHALNRVRADRGMEPYVVWADGVHLADLKALAERLRPRTGAS